MHGAGHRQTRPDTKSEITPIERTDSDSFGRGRGFLVRK
jgi:hypothetical protein